MGAITGQSSLIFVFHPIRLSKKQGRADMLAAFSTKDLEKKPSRRIETFQAVSTNISSKMPTAFLVKKAKKKKRDRRAKQSVKRQSAGPEQVTTLQRNQSVHTAWAQRKSCYEFSLLTPLPSLL